MWDIISLISLVIDKCREKWHLQTQHLAYLANCCKVLLNWDKGYRMVFASTCEQASSTFIFASTSSDQICLASSEH